MNKEYIEKIYEENKDKFLDNGLDIISANDLEDFLKEIINSNFMFDFDYDIITDKLFLKGWNRDGSTGRPHDKKHSGCRKINREASAS